MLISIVKSSPLHIQIYHLIKKHLIEEYYQPDERLVEVKLAEEFGASRGPVRESLRMLIQDELIIQRGNALKVF